MDIPPTPQASYLIGRFRELMDEGFTSTEIRSTLRDEGLKFSNSMASQIFRGIRDANPTDIRFQPGSELVNPDTFNITKFDMPAQYGFMVAVTITDTVTGESRQGLHMIFQDDLDTLDNILERAAQTLEEDYYQGNATVERIDIVNAYSQ